MKNRTRSFLTFRVGREWYGVPVDAIIEVLHMVAINEVPGTETLGVITLRERPVRVFDLRPRFGVSAPEYRLDTPIIAVNTAQGGVGLVVDETDDVLQIAPEAISSYHNDLIEGTFRLKDRMIFILEVSQLEPESNAQPG